MIRTQSIPPGAALKFKYCIVGSGPAGLTVARELAREHDDVCLLEAGGVEAASSDSRLFYGQESGYDMGLQKYRMRCFGGTTGHWTGWCSTLDDSDFESWPITAKDLRPHYEEVLADLNLRQSYFQEREKFLNKELAAGLQLKYFQFSDPIARYGKKFRELVDSSQKLELIPHSVVHYLERDPSSKKISRIHVRHRQDSQYYVEAQHYILALGGVENARLLLSTAKRDQEPLGDGTQFLGRGFMEHPTLEKAGRLILFGSHPLTSYTEDNNPQATQHFFQISSSKRQQKNLLNSVLRLHRSQAESAMEKDLVQFYSKSLGYENVAVRNLDLMNEQIWSSASVLQLKSEQDPFGIYKINLKWELTEKDWLSYQKSLRFFAKRLAQIGFGVMKLNPKVFSESLEPKPAAHHMGLTKMGSSSKEGYVDKNLKVFGLDNLSVVGASVFPTGGCANPTLTIAAFAHRLAHHLKQEKA